VTRPDASRRLLHDNLSACSERIISLVYSVNKNAGILPLDLDSLAGLSDEQKESIDALILRYSQCLSMLQDQIFRGIAVVEQEDLSDKSNRDKTLLMEKLGVIRSADAFGSAAILRNKFSHHYPEKSKDQLNKLNLLIDESIFLIGVYDDALTYLTSKGFLAKDHGWSNQTGQVRHLATIRN
jgi:hypothetical protein